MEVQKITIIGLGLIGGSLGMALKKANPQLEVCGVDVRPETISEAQYRKAIDWGTADLGKAVENAHMIFLATPLKKMRQVVSGMLPYLQEGTIISDVGSVKEPIVEFMEATLPAGIHFIGGHPMAGSEKWGIQGASEILFENAAYILTPSSRTHLNALDVLRNLVESLGAKVILLTPGDHDCKVAAVSHLPHLVASALVNMVGALENKERGYFSLAAGGFRDTTRIAASNSELWCDILLQNSSAVLPLIKGFRQSLLEFERALNRNDPDSLVQLLTRARHWREKVPTGLKGLVPRLYELTVMVPDRPGAIAELSLLLGSHNINISDIEIQRVREENEGTIRLGFLKEELRDQALEVLEQHSLSVRTSG